MAQGVQFLKCELKSKLLVSPIVVPHIIPNVTPFKEYRLWRMRESSLGGPNDGALPLIHILI